MMKHVFAIAAAAGIVVAATAGAMAQNSMAPGQQMQEKGSVKGSPGASGYAPGHRMQQNGSVKGTNGASGYAPGKNKSTTGSNVDRDDYRNGTKSNMGGGGSKAK